MPRLNKEEQLRYSRQISLEEIGESGQLKLKNSKVLIIGAGGLGSPVAMYLAAAGVGHLGLIDSDSVSLSNLQRQIIHLTDDISRYKVISAKEKLNRLNPNVYVVTYNEMLTPQNSSQIISDYDFIIDSTDTPKAKFLINDTCIGLNKPFSYGGITGFQGATMTHINGSACLRCLFDDTPRKETITGPIGAVAGVIGSIQAAEAIKFITNCGELITDTLLTFDCLTMNFSRFNLSKRIDCPACHRHSAINTPT